MAPAAVLYPPSPAHPALTVTAPSSPPPRPTITAPARPGTLHPSSALRPRSRSPARRSLPAPVPLAPRRSPLALPLPGESPVPGGNFGCPDCLGVSGPYSPHLTLAEEERLVNVVMSGPWPVDMAFVARRMGRETPAYWGARIAEIRAAWPTMFQSVIERRSDPWKRGFDEEAKKRLDKQFLR